MTVAILQYNAGNTRSVAYALERLGVSPVISSDPEVLYRADKLIFPGVGHAKAAMEFLQAHALDDVLRQYERPLLGICLGMQLLCAYSEEGEQACLGLFEGRVMRFSQAPKVPHLGWNQVQELEGPLFEGLPTESYFYFVHSYCVPLLAQTTAQCAYGQPFSAALADGQRFAVQFHPEKSGAAGERLLQNFLAL